MGGWRHFLLWTDKPHYHHWPVDGYRPMRDTDHKATYTDRGWAYNGDRKSGCRVKPLVKQNPQLQSNAWKLAFWSCIPKTENVSLEDTFKWADTLLPGEDSSKEFHRTNSDTLMWHVGGESDSNANVHYRRFLMEVNLITAECKIVVPRVHFYDTNSTLDTQDIDEHYGSRQNYCCPQMDEYRLPF